MGRVNERSGALRTYTDADVERRVTEAGKHSARSAYARDRARVLHSWALRRLAAKTQVVVPWESDFPRTRLTHSLEVAQIGRELGQALGCDPDLVETAGLAHDLGHPPFGHVGEEALDEAMAGHGGFRHNAQGSRIVDYLEDPHGHGAGLNLTLAIRQSLLKGRIPDGFPLSPDLVPRGAVPLEANLVDLCDKIAYLSHDLDDGLRAGLFTDAEAAELRLWQRARDAAASSDRPRIVSEVASLLIHDLVEAADATLTATPAGGTAPRLAHSPTMAVLANELLEFLRARFYRSPRVLTAMNDGADRIRRLFAILLQDPARLPDGARRRIGRDGLQRVVCDYIAGMTDRYLHRATNVD